MRHILASALALVSVWASAQTHSLSTNLLTDCAGTPSAALSTVVSRQWTIGIETVFCPIETSSHDLRFVSAGLAARRWIYEPYAGHFIAFGADWVGYSIGTIESPYRGNAVVAGIGYGYAWLIGARWNIECSAGVGLAAMADKRRITEFPSGVQYIHYYRRLTIVPYSVGVTVSYLF